MAAENPHMGHSIFNMEHITAVTAMTDLTIAKNYVIDLIKVSTANNKNRIKILAIVSSCKTINNLAITMTNHMLAHPSENLKVSR